MKAGSAINQRNTNPPQPQQHSCFHEDALELYRSIMESSTDAILIHFLTPEGLPEAFIEVNQVTCTKLGYTREELLQLTPFDIDHQLTPQTFPSIAQNLIAHKSILHEATLTSKDGHSYPVELNLNSFTLRGRSAVLVIARDISERKHFEQQLDRLDRLHLVGEIAASIGHEVRNPMTTVRGFLQLLGGKREFASHREYFDLMIDELDRANLIITEFLSLAKGKSIHLETNSLNTVIEAIYPLLEAASNLDSKRIELDLHIIASLPLDTKEMRQLILNLACNGLEAMAPGGTLTIRTQMDKEHVILSVSDEGTGIPPEILSKIGTPFFTTKMYGTGLGLAICYSIAARHNAIIHIDSTTKGTTFSILFKRHKT